MADRRWRFKFEWAERFGHPTFMYIVVGRDGGLHLSITDYGEEHGKKYGDRYSGGLEMHSRTATDDRPPDHTDCWVTGGLCWHDGTSLYVSETVIPLWLAGDPFDMSFWRNWMVGEADSRFNRDAE